MVTRRLLRWTAAVLVGLALALPFALPPVTGHALLVLDGGSAGAALGRGDVLLTRPPAALRPGQVLVVGEPPEARAYRLLAVEADRVRLQDALDDWVDRSTVSGVVVAAVTGRPAAPARVLLGPPGTMLLLGVLAVLVLPPPRRSRRARPHPDLPGSGPATP